MIYIKIIKCSFVSGFDKQNWKCYKFILHMNGGHIFYLVVVVVVVAAVVVVVVVVVAAGLFVVCISWLFYMYMYMYMYMYELGWWER